MGRMESNESEGRGINKYSSGEEYDGEWKMLWRKAMVSLGISTVPCMVDSRKMVIKKG